MAIWIELRCERRGEGLDASSGTRCWSDDNHGPGEMADDTLASMSSVYQFLKQDAANAGWELVRGEGWVCPSCVKGEPS